MALYALFRLKKNDNDVAWICVDKYLYIVAPKKTNKCNDDWTQYESDINLQWKYITSGKSKKIQLNVPTVLENDLSIDLANLLEGVVD